ncbi:MAG: hypothetical protein WC486_06015 [Candidatus Omnitrophota bacterium]|jgi:hypothetical protein
MLRAAALMMLALFLVSGFCLYGCQTVKKTEQQAERRFELDSDAAYPQGVEAQVEEYGEP